MTYDEFSEIVIEGYLRTYNIRETMKETGRSFDEVWKMVGMKDWFEWVEDVNEWSSCWSFWLPWGHQWSEKSQKPSNSGFLKRLKNNVSSPQKRFGSHYLWFPWKRDVNPGEMTKNRRWRKSKLEGLIGVFLLGLIIYLIIRYPLRALSLAFKLVIIFALGVAGFIGLYALLISWKDSSV